MSDEARADAIAQIEQTLRNLGLLEFAGEAQLLEWSKSTSRDGPKVKLLLPDDESIEPFQRATVRKGGQAGQLYYVFAVAMDEPARNNPPPQSAQLTSRGEGSAVPAESRPNQLAGDMHRMGYFRNPKLWAAMHESGFYTQAEHKAWIKSLPCWYPANAPRPRRPEHESCGGDIVPHHCKSAADPAAGASTKNPQKPPDWFGLPLCHNHHTIYAHSSVGADRAGKEAMRLAAIQMTADRVKWAMKGHLGIESMSLITPELLANFEIEIGL